MKKALINFLLLLIMMFMVNTKTYAYENNVINELKESGNIYHDTIPKDISNFINKNFYILLDSLKNSHGNYELMEKELNDLYIGEGFNTYIFTENSFHNSDIYVFPVISNQTVKFILSITSNGDGTYSATLGRDFADQLNELLCHNTKSDPFVIWSDKNNLYAENKNNLIKLTPYSYTSYMNNNLNYLINKKDRLLLIDSFDKTKKISNITSNFLKINTKIINPNYNILSSKNLNLELINQRDNNGKKRNMCAAACIASITNYKLKTSLNAMNVCSLMGIGYDQGASIKDVSNALTKLGVNSYYKTSNLANNEIRININNSNPIYMASYGSGYGHATVISGYETYLYDGYTDFVLNLMDPYDECFKSAYSSGNTFTYTYAGGIKMVWRESVLLRN